MTMIAKRSVVELDAKDLTEEGAIFCPNPNAGMVLWNEHPRVYLYLGRAEQVTCPYCSTVYKLKPGQKPDLH